MRCIAFPYEDAYYFQVPEEIPAIWVKMAGIDYCSDTYHMERQCSSVTVLEYVYSGRGTLWLDGKEYHPKAGDVYILPQGCRQDYYTDKHDPWVKIYVNLQGTAVPGILQAFGLHKKVLYGNCRSLAPIFEEILHAALQNKAVEQIMEQCAMLLIKLLTRLSASSTDQAELHLPQIPAEVQVVKSFIDSNYRLNLTMDDIAAAVYRSNDYVKKLFKQCYGITPYAYYLQVKVTHAKYLLRHTNLPIKQIADKLGYKSDRYFSKRFREMVGMTATGYRNSQATDENEV